MKKKLIAAVTSLVMVATLAPATAFASTTGTVSGNDTTATRQAVNQDAVNAAKEAIEAVVGAVDGPNVQINYTESGKPLENATKLYTALNAEEKVILGDALADRLEKGNALYKNYTKAISEVETAFAAVTSIKAGDAQDSKTAYGKANDLWTASKVDQVSAGSNGGVGAAALTNSDIRAAVNDETKKKQEDAAAAYAVANRIIAVEITDDNYNANPAVTKSATDEYNGLTAAQQALVGNYGVIVGMDNDIAAFKKAVADLTELSTAAYKAAVTNNISATEKETGIDKATADVAAVKSAFNALDAKKQAAVVKNDALKISTKDIEDAEDNIKAYNDKVAASKAAEPVIKLIRDLKAGTSISLEDGTAITEARTAYNALDDEAKKFVKNEATYKNAYNVNYEQVLSDAEETYQTKVEAQTTDARIEKMNALLKALPDEANSIDLEKHEAAVNEAIAYFNIGDGTVGATLAADGTLSGTAAEWQKIFVMGSKIDINEENATSDYLKLKACVQVLHDKLTTETNNVNTYIAKYLTGPGNESLAKYAGSSDYIGTNATKLANAKTNLAAAKSELAELTAREQEKVKDNPAYANIEATEKAIEAAETRIADTATAKNIEDLIDAIGTITAADITSETLSKYESKIEAANKAYTEASQQAKGLVDPDKAANLLSLVAKVKDLKDGTSVAGIEEKIAAVPVVKTDGTETEDTLLAAQTQLKEAQTLFDGLSSNVQGQISNAGRLATAQKALTAAAKKLADAEFAKIGNITAGITDAQIEQFNKVNAILDEFGLEKTDLTAVEAYNAVETAVNAKNAADLKAVKDGIKALPATVTKNNIADVYDLQNAYNALSDKQKEQITDAEKAKLDKAVAEADALSLAKAKIDAIADQTYTGNEINVDVVVKDVNGTVIPKDAYEVSYNDNKAVGTATVVVNAKADSKYAGTAKQTFEIVAASIEDATVTGIATKTYTGKALTQVAKVIVGDKTLALGTDYTVAYKNNTKVGKATMTITAQGNYKGELTKTFVVKPGKATVTSLKAGKKKATVKIKSIPGATYKIAYKQRGNGYKYKTVKTTSLSKTITGLKSGKVYKVKVLAFTRVDGKTYYTGYSTIKTVKVK